MRSTAAIEGHLPLVKKIASEVRRKIGGSVELDDLVAYGTRGLIEATQRFDASRGFAFSTFAYYRIRGAIYDGLREMGWRKRDRSRRAQTFEENAGHVLQQAAEDAPPVGAAGEAEAVEGAITLLATAWIVSIEAEAGLHLADAAPDAEARVADLSERSAVRAALAKLPERERRILDLMYFEERSLTEASAELGLSKAWTCRLHARALKVLGDLLAERGVAPEQRRAPGVR